MADPSTTGTPRWLRARYGQVARRIAQAFGLLERAVLLLVHDDEAQCRQRREHREPGAQHDAGPPFGCRTPVVEALGFGKSAMKARSARAREAACHQRLELRRQRDLRHQQERLLACFERGGNRVQVDLGLAAAGDAEQKIRVIAAHAAQDLGERLCLRGGEHWRRRNHRGRRCAGFGFGDPHPAAGDELADERLRLGIRRPGLGLRERSSSQPLHQPVLGSGAGRQRRRLERGAGGSEMVGAATGLARRAGDATQARRQRTDHHGAQGMTIVLGGESHQAQVLGRKRRKVAQHLDRALQPLGGHFARPRGLDDHADRGLPAERHHNAAADVG